MKQMKAKKSCEKGYPAKDIVFFPFLSPHIFLHVSDAFERSKLKKKRYFYMKKWIKLQPNGRAFLLSDRRFTELKQAKKTWYRIFDLMVAFGSKPMMEKMVKTFWNDYFKT